MKTGFLAVVLVMTMICIAAQAQQPAAYDQRPKITVSGEAVVNVKPDIVIISLGIETSDADINVAKQKNNEIMKKAVAAMKEIGVPEKDIQTDYISVAPRWRNESLRDTFLGYFVRNSLVVTLEEAAKVEDLVTRVLQAGVNYINGVDFQAVQFKQYREQARELALKAAKEKAEKMAAVLGQTVGAPIQISENYVGSPSSYWSGWYGWGRPSGANSQVNVLVDRGNTGDVTDTIALGKLAIRANVSVTFELKK
jgi:hypothetical protein